MMYGLLVGAESIARAAQRRRLQQIAAGLRGRGVTVEVAADSVVIRGRRLVQRWLSDPLLRFAGRMSA
jgi:hypothetical protein